MRTFSAISRGGCERRRVACCKGSDRAVNRPRLILVSWRPSIKGSRRLQKRHSERLLTVRYVQNGADLLTAGARGSDIGPANRGMLRMAMLKLPPEMRIALAVKIFTSFGRQSGVLAPLRISLPPTYSQHELHHVPAGRRHYATVNVDDTTKLWSEHGKEPPSESTGTSGTIEETPDQQQHASSSPLSGAKIASETTEQEQLLFAVESKFRQSASSMQPRLRECINNAMESQQPVAALKALANSDPHTWGPAKSTIKDQPRIRFKT